jgi:hypothetical protein
VVAGAHASTLPPPSFRVAGSARVLAAAGQRVAIATDTVCAVRVAVLAARAKPATVRPRECGSGESAIWDLWLGRSAVAAETIDAPSPHGESYGLWTGPLPRGPLRQRGDDWGWRDDDVPAGWGCASSVAAGGGVIAFARVPNRLGVDAGFDETPACPAGATSRIVLLGATSSQVMVPGSWSVLATDGKRIALARLDADGLETGQAELVDLAGNRLAMPAVAPGVVRSAYRAWLAPQGLVLETTRGVVGPGWTVRGAHAATVGEGRVFYLRGRTIHVRRVGAGPDRALLALRSTHALLAAGAFGLAIAVFPGPPTTVYRIPWRTIDRTVRAG